MQARFDHYPLGHDRKEQLRLAEQGVILRPTTERLLATARSRVASRGLGWARFVEGNVGSIPLTRLATAPFDAVVGRLVLMYQPDPTAVLRHLAAMVKPGGLVVFQEGVAFAPRARVGRPLIDSGHTILRQTGQCADACRSGEFLQLACGADGGSGGLRESPLQLPQLIMRRL